jgi:lipoate-protein ligase A
MERGMSLCFSCSAEYEIVVQGKKVVGSAQKRGRRALLQQGSIFVRRTGREAFSILRKSTGEINAVSVEEVLGREVGFGEISEALVYGFEKIFNFKF